MLLLTRIVVAILTCLVALVASALAASSAAGHLTLAQDAGRSYTAEAEQDRVVELPGYGKPDFGLFSGYVTVDDDAERALFYAFAESATNSREHPLVLWLNGGPGCSSLAGGFLSELGPFYPTPEGTLERNKYAWNEVANIIFLESPAFVGWSYSNTSSDIVVGDERTAEDAYQFLQGFLERFPEYAGRPFWVAGESYGGHYVPNLALKILEGNRRAEQNGAAQINLQGFLIGNAWTDPAYDNQGAVDFWWTHALISDTIRDSLLHDCNFSGIGPLATVDYSSTDDLDKSKVEACLEAITKVQRGMSRINIYDIYADVCLPKHNEVTQLASQLSSNGFNLSSTVAAVGAGKYDPCVDNEVEIYFNREEVQQAMHGNTTGLPGPWQGCNPLIAYSRQDLFNSMLPKYHNIFQHDKNLRILIFSGDVDGIVPVMGTRSWLASLQLPILQEWRPWYSLTGQVGGYVEEYDGLTFSTVRNAGHMVPYTQPERAFHLFSHWIHGKEL